MHFLDGKRLFMRHTRQYTLYLHRPTSFYLTSLHVKAANILDVI